jgi:exodeoxyribonuclease VII large subunit
MQEPEAPMVVPVGRLANYINRKLKADPKLKFLGVTGEVSNLRRPEMGHCYFDLKDRDALIACVAWASAAIQFPPFANGDLVTAFGGITTFEKRSTYQLDVVRVDAAGGVGHLQAAYEKLRLLLDAEGLFARPKRPLPPYPFTVALVSSAASDGARDFFAVRDRRAPHIAVKLVDTPVQGPNAPAEIVAALRRAAMLQPDVIVLARGGGSYEDLFTFSHESVVRALAAMPVPTVSAIGHNSDTPLCDLVADLRAATPTAAGELVLPERATLVARVDRTRSVLLRRVQNELRHERQALERFAVHSPLASAERFFGPRVQTLDAIGRDLRAHVERRVRERGERLVRAERSLARFEPTRKLAAERERVAALARRLDEALRAKTALGERIRTARMTLDALAARTLAAARQRYGITLAHLDGKNPEAILQRGYAIVSVDGRIVRDAAVVPPGAILRAQVARGTLTAIVETTDGDGG